MNTKTIVNIFIIVMALGVGAFIGVYQIQKPSSAIVIVDQIKNITELATVSYHVTTLEERTPKKTEGMTYEKVTVLLIWPGVVKAGIDLKKANFEFNDENTILTVSLPPAEILSATPDTGGFKSYVIKRHGSGLGKDPSGTLVAKWAGEHSNQLKKAADKVNIKKLALEEAKKSIEILASSVGVSTKFSGK